MYFVLLNAGSSSLKVSIAEDDNIFYSKTFNAPPATFDDNKWAEILSEINNNAKTIDVFVHRVVHGGRLFGHACFVNDKVMKGIQELSALAPLHQPPSIDVLEKFRELFPTSKQIACFDTAFHSNMPSEAYAYAIPKEWRDNLGVRRYGFHGLAHEYNLNEAADILNKDILDIKVISAHLGSGASLCAIKDGVSVDTTMGFTPLEGLVMSTRSGTIDPAISAWLVDNTNLSVREVITKLERESGLKALAGTEDMAEIIQRAGSAEHEARIALEIWAHRTACMIGSMIVSAGGIDCLAFSGGIGENSPQARSLVLNKLRPFGIRYAQTANNRNKPSSRIESVSSSCAILIINTREDITMVRQAQAILWQQ